MSIETEARRESQHDFAPGAVAADEFGLPRGMIETLLDGARARGIADAFEMMGRAAVLIDMAGSVLHVGSHARAMFEADLSVAGGHLIGTDAVTNQALAKVIAIAIGSPDVSPAEGSAVIGAANGTRALRITVLPVSSEKKSPFRRLCAVVLIEPA